MGKIKPFVKWAGGKGNLISQLVNFYPSELERGNITTYVEPFVGGGAVLIDILQKFDIKKAYAFDINLDLINSYNVVKNNVNELVHKLSIIENEFKSLTLEDKEKFYYNTRENYNSYRIFEDDINVDRAVEFIFLNRTCFNGLYRVNKNGKFNVPFGKYKNPTICDSDNLFRLSCLLENVLFKYGDYSISEKFIDSSTFVYFDPPYRPLSNTAGFTSYTKENFNDDNQKELASYYAKLNKKNAKLMLSNSNPKNIDKTDNFFEKIYEGYNINKVLAKRMINSDVKGRGEIFELLITNYRSK